MIADLLLPLAPLIAVVALVLARCKPVIAAMGGVAVAMVVMPVLGLVVPVASLRGAASTVAILTLSVSLVLVPAQYLNSVLRARGVLAGLAERVVQSRLARERKVLILLFGVAPALESLTGFGVSLFLTVPILLRLYPAETACRLAVLGMASATWGAMAIGTLLGARLSGIDPSALGIASSLMSAAAFPVFALAATWAMDGRRGLARHGGFAAMLGVLLPALLYIAQRWLPVEMAGIVAGVGASLAGYLIARRTGDVASSDGGDTRPPAALLAPYLLLFALVTGSRMIPPLWRALSGALVLETPTVRFSPLASPGLMMLMTALLLQARRRVAVPLDAVLVGAMRPVTAIFAFLVLAQTMRAGGLVAALAGAVTSLGPAARGLSPLAGMVSGFIAGSATGGNALMMPLQAALGEATGHTLRFAAMQNCAAGHTVFAAVPVLVLTVTVARDSGSVPVSVPRLLRFVLTVAALLLVVLTIVFVGGCAG
jgi:lactate permease